MKYKYRIIEEKNYFKIQKKIFFYGWTTMDNCEMFHSFYETSFPYKFKTLEEAKNFVTILKIRNNKSFALLNLRNDNKDIKREAELKLNRNIVYIED
jgi:hypothetical protein